MTEFLVVSGFITWRFVSAHFHSLVDFQHESIDDVIGKHGELVGLYQNQFIHL